MILKTVVCVFDADAAKAMADAGADPLVTYVGLTTAGSIGAAVALILDQAVEKVLKIAEAGRKVRPEIFGICYGGPFDEPEHLGKAIAKMLHIQDLFAASPIERLPTERGVRGQVESFKSLKMG